MKLYIKQKVFSWRDKFNIFDENQNTVYYAESEFLTFGKKFHLYNSVGSEVAFISQKLLTFLPRFFVYRNGIEAAEVVKDFTLFRQKYTVNGPGWDIDGDFWAHEYIISDGRRTVASINKRWLTWGDTYEIDIADAADTVLVLSVVLVIDAIMSDSNDTNTSINVNI